jgi:hypothetical protein
MTVSNVTDRTSATGEAAVGQTIDFDFPILNTSDVKVYTRVTADGTEATLTETTNYTVSINGNSGGTVTMVTSVAATSVIHVIRDTPLTQTLSLVDGGDFSASDIMAALDKLHRIVIDHDVRIARCLSIPVTDDGTLDLVIPDSIDRASEYATYDSSGNVDSSAT